MIILNKKPVTIDLNTHGGVTVHFEGFSVWNTLEKAWGVMVCNANLHGENGRIRKFDSFVDAYEAGVKETTGGPAIHCDDCSVWIPATEKMPPDTSGGAATILLWDGDRVICGGWADHGNGDGVWYEDNYSGEITGVTHWMPLPSGPNERERIHTQETMTMQKPIEEPTASPEPNTPPGGGCDGTDCSQVFPLTTLRDIFNLPTFEQMATCLDELKICMTQARATNDLMVVLVNQKGHDIKKAFEWPEVLEWKDDGKGDVRTAYAGPDGKEVFSMKLSRDPG